MMTVKTFFVGTTNGVDVINIGHDVRGLLRETQVDAGLVTIGCRLSGGVITILPAEGRQALEMREQIKKDLAETPAGVKQLLSPCLSIPVEGGRMLFEPWRDLFLVDFDTGGRRREIVIQLFSEPKAQPGPQGGRR